MKGSTGSDEAEEKNHPNQQLLLALHNFVVGLCFCCLAFQFIDSLFLVYSHLMASQSVAQKCCNVTKKEWGTHQRIIILSFINRSTSWFNFDQTLSYLYHSKCLQRASTCIHDWGPKSPHEILKGKQNNLKKSIRGGIRQRSDEMSDYNGSLVLFKSIQVQSVASAVMHTRQLARCWLA